MAARPIWTGTLSFGLLNVPVQLMTGERRSELHFRMLDGRNNAAVKYERKNAETGEDVPWNEIVKAYEYEKGNYVVLEPEDIKNASPTGRESVEIETFVDGASIPPQYYDKPYVLVPGKKAEKGYVLLRETLKETGKVGIGRVVLRTKEYLCAVLPQDDALVLEILRFEDEVVDASEYKLPSGKTDEYRVNDKELKMARQLIESMSDEWKPSDFKDQFSVRLHKVIEERMKQKGLVSHIEGKDEDESEAATTNVVDFMALLQKSLTSNKRTPAAKTAPRAKSAPAKKVAAKKAARAAGAGGAKKSVAKKAHAATKQSAPIKAPRRRSA
jgi:DNA end-binding protein Ku